ncbi:hypothetical protein [Labrys wisconsinensis]|uniref:Uncharacterized protein n=1 Tax=Labrys wisconsinensis TaxID=425677 RepID=A0ABU0JCN3_9HYPH|nr:hypothetical protein [Labrys wisconsinensis]MDQ0471360.1 hypothetical protein [Labrys wisconsinensis]
MRRGNDDPLPAVLVLAIVLVGFGGLVALDARTGLVSRAWLPLFWGAVLLAAILIQVRAWKARASRVAMRKIEARSLYGLLPERLREWLFPSGSVGE